MRIRLLFATCLCLLAARGAATPDALRDRDRAPSSRAPAPASATIDAIVPTAAADEPPANWRWRPRLPTAAAY